MITCGIDIKGSDAIFVILDAHKNVVPLDEKKISLENGDNAESIQTMYSDLKSWLFKHHVDQICIKMRLKKGKFAGGPESFKIEALLQMMDFCTVSLVSPQALAKFQKNTEEPIPESILKYQENAYLAALYRLTND